MAVVAYPSTLVAEEIPDQNNALAASLLTSLIENNRSIHSYDVSFSTEFVVLHPTQGVKIRDATTRVVHNDETGKTTTARSATGDTLVYSGTDASKTFANLALCFQDGSTSVRLFDLAGSRRVRLSNPAQRRRLSGNPMFHSIGIVSFPHVVGQLTSSDGYWNSLQVIDANTTAAIVGENRCRVVKRIFDNEEAASEIVWTFDLTNLLPVSRSTYFYHTETRERILAEIEDLEWTICDGHNVPEMIRRETKQLARIEGSGTRLKYSQIYETSFDWVSVNKPLAATFFDPTKIRSVDDISAFLKQSNGDASERQFATD